MYKLVNDRRLKSAVFSGPRFHVCLSVGRGFHITVTFSPPEYMLETSESPVTLWESTGVCHCVCMAKKQKMHAKWETHSRNSTANCHFLPLLLRVWAATEDLCVCVMLMYAGKRFCWCIKDHDRMYILWCRSIMCLCHWSWEKETVRQSESLYK